jgi:hypothetical protein
MIDILTLTLDSPIRDLGRIFGPSESEDIGGIQVFCYIILYEYLRKIKLPKNQSNLM